MESGPFLIDDLGSTGYPVKRNMLVRHLRRHGAYLIREGKKHSIFQRGNLKTEVPRHTEIFDDLARKICRDLNMPFVR
jgi:mRNA interferase HicA